MSQVKPLLFWAKGGTMGDLKPLAILAVIAARTSKTPVTFVHRFNTHFRFLDKLARFMIGDNYHEFLHIIPMEPLQPRNPNHKIVVPLNVTLFDTSTLDQYFSFGQVGDLNSYADYSVKLDFGDNGESKNRFVSCLLSEYHPNCFGSLYLPSKLTWSSPIIMENLQNFKTANQGKKMMVIAGSLKLPISYYELFTWFETNENFSNWAFILLGYNDVTKTPSDFYAAKELMEKYFHHDQVFIVQDYVEYEDVVKFADFFISNCGAGSVLVPLAAGVPQTCDWIEEIQGSDKKSNLRSISPLVHHVGPGRPDNFPSLMKDLDKKLKMYSENSVKLARVVKLETEIMLGNMSRFFELLSMDKNLQEEIMTTGMIPSEFALPDCTTEQNPKKVKY
jgi:hypothetical protein